MKKTILTALALLLFAGIFAQTGNVVLFSENGEHFYAILNGTRMNDQPVTNLKISDLNQPAYKLKVVFENTDLGEMDKNIYPEIGSEAVFMIKQDKKGRYKLAYRSAAPIDQAPPVGADCYVYQWGAVAQPQVQVVQQTTAVTPVNAGVTTTVVEHTTTTTDVGTGTGDNVSMNVNVDGFGMNVNINTNDAIVTEEVSMTTTTTTTTTTAGTYGQVEEVYIEEPAPCAMMNTADFNSAKSSIESKSFSDSKMTLAKQITRNHCVSAQQVRSIMELFDFEDGKLEYAKFAYDFCYDINNYYQVNDAFTFEASIEELDEYIGGR